jgi:hypothetical protein
MPYLGRCLWVPIEPPMAGPGDQRWMDDLGDWLGATAQPIIFMGTGWGYFMGYY